MIAMTWSDGMPLTSCSLGSWSPTHAAHGWAPVVLHSFGPRFADVLGVGLGEEVGAGFAFFVVGVGRVSWRAFPLRLHVWPLGEDGRSGVWCSTLACLYIALFAVYLNPHQLIAPSNPTTVVEHEHVRDQ